MRRSSREVTRSVGLGQEAEEGSEGRGALDHLLQVVEQEEHLPVCDVLGERVLGAERLRDRFRHERGISERRKPDPEETPALNCGTSVAAASMENRVSPVPPGPVRVRRRAPPLIRESTSCSSASLPRKLEAGLGRFVFEIVLSGGKLPTPELVDGDSLLDVLELVLAEIGERSVYEPCRPLGEDNLTAVTRGGDASGKVDVVSDIALLGKKRRPGVQADAHQDRAGGERLRYARGSSERSRRGREGEEEGIALRVHLDPGFCPAASRITRRCSASASA